MGEDGVKKKRGGGRPRGSRRTKGSGAGPRLDKYDCYELCVQNPARMAPFLRAVHGGDPIILREDFCGTGGVCRAWASMTPLAAGRRRRALRAIGVDRDPEPLARSRGVAGVRVVRSDVRDCDAAADVLTATNFSIGYWHTRRDLVRYLKLCRARVRPGGVFVCDTYGGATAFTTGTLTRDVWLDDGVRVRYTWEQREADPLTGRVLDVLHFRADRAGDVIFEQSDAFTYDWRLWSVPELREALRDAGFAEVLVYAELADAVDSEGRVYVRPVAGPEDLDESFVVLIAARAPDAGR